MEMFENNSNEFKDAGNLLYDNDYCNASFHAFYYCVFNRAVNYLIKYSDICLNIKIEDQKQLLDEYKRRRNLAPGTTNKTSQGYHEWVINLTYHNFSGTYQEKKYFEGCFLMIKDFRTQADYNPVLITKNTFHLVNPKVNGFTEFFSSFEYLVNQLNQMLSNEK